MPSVHPCDLARVWRDSDGFLLNCLRTDTVCLPACPRVPPGLHATDVLLPWAEHAPPRGCGTCRPYAPGGDPAVLAPRALKLIAHGGLIGHGGRIPDLANRLGYSVRHLERRLRAELGVGPLALVRAQRAQTARLLIERTGMSMAQVAFTAGFASIRTFNDTMREVFDRSPMQLRRMPARRPGQG